MLSAHKAEYDKKKYEKPALKIAVSRTFRLGVRVQIYLAISILLFAFGPCDWNIRNPFLLYGYVLLGQIAIAAGMFFGAMRPARTYLWNQDPVILLSWSLVLTLFIAPAQIISRNFSGVSVLETILDPALAYKGSSEGVRDYFALSVVSTVVAPVRCLLVPLMVTCWSKIKFFVKAVCVVAITLEVMISLISGQAFGVFDVMLLLTLASYLNKGIRNSFTENYSFNSSKRVTSYRRHRWMAIFVSGAAIAAAISYFIQSRMARLGENIPRESVSWAPTILGLKLPESIEFGIYFLIRYLTIGYYGLAGCLELPFHWTYGFGHAAFLRRYAVIFNADWEWTFRDTYPARLEQATGYSTANYWHTSYPWLASDFTFFGALLIVGCVGYLFLRTAKEFIVETNPFALSACSQLFLVLVYLPASCERVNRPEAAFALYGSLILWYLSTRKK